MREGEALLFSPPNHRVKALALGVGFVSCAFAAGCGFAVGGNAAGRPLFVSECDQPLGGDVETEDLVVLDWAGGTSPIYAEYEFDGLDLTLFGTGSAGTLADDAELFKERVRQEIVNIYCGTGEVSISVRNEPLAERHSVTTVLLTQDLQPDNGGDIGEAEYDPCNRQHDNSALVFGERILDLAGPNTFDEWVILFANVCAHEIGHTLGFGHIQRNAQPTAGRSVYVELMLDGHTIDEMRLPQRFVYAQTSCPDDFDPTIGRVLAISLP